MRFCNGDSFYGKNKRVVDSDWTSCSYKCYINVPVISPAGYRFYGDTCIMKIRKRKTKVGIFLESGPSTSFFVSNASFTALLPDVRVHCWAQSAPLARHCCPTLLQLSSMNHNVTLRNPLLRLCNKLSGISKTVGQTVPYSCSDGGNVSPEGNKKNQWINR